MKKKLFDLDEMQKFTKLTQFHNTQFLIIKLIASKSVMINLMCKFYKKMFNWEKKCYM